MAYATTARTISDAAKQLKLVKADIADPFSSSDANIVQLCALLNSLGRKLTLAHNWSQLVTQYTFPTVAAQEAYALPADFNSMIDQSSWNRTTRFPVSGPMSGQAWQYLKALPNAATLTVLFRKYQGSLLLYPVPSDVQTIAYEYLSTYWVAPTATPTVRTTDSTTIKNDVLFFDSELLVLGLKAEFLGENNLPVDKAMMDYEARLEQVKNQEPAPVISLIGDQVFIPLLGDANVPYTNFGS